MGASRLTLALDEGGLVLPAGGDILVLNPVSGAVFDPLPQARLVVVQGQRPDHDALAARGLRVRPDLPPGRFSAAVVFLPRARAAAEAALAAAEALVLPGGPVVVDGARDDGVDAMLRALKARVALSDALPRAHGKIAWFPAGNALAAWARGPRALPDGWVTAPGVFSADGPDPGSVALAAALPARLRGHGADVGAGWGYLSRAVLSLAGVAALDLVEADHAALACARANVTDPRAAFHWADATAWRAPRPLDFVVMNPPFHRGRAADPRLGEAFFAAAARNLAPSGTLWLVANRGLPYDRPLRGLFREVQEIGADPSYRLTRAARPLPRR